MLKFRLRALILAAVLLGSGIGLSTKFAMDYADEPTLDEMLKQIDEDTRRLVHEFATANPVSLDGWTAIQSVHSPKSVLWSQGGIVYSDRNSDGLPDIKYRQEYRSTTQVWWEDSDYDGMFDTEVERGCFHHITRPLDRVMPVPLAPGQNIRPVAITN